MPDAEIPTLEFSREPPPAVLPRNRRILIVDDDPDVHDHFRRILAALGDSTPSDTAKGDGASELDAFAMESAYSGEEALAEMKTSLTAGTPFALAFVDMKMGSGWDGDETIQQLWLADPELQVVICTGFLDYSWADLIEKFGVVDKLLILRKPFDIIEVCQLATALTEKWLLSKRARLNVDQLEAMVEARTRDLTAAKQSLEAEVMRRKGSEDALRESQERYALSVTGANDGLWDWDLVGKLMFCSNRWNAMLGLPAEDTLDSPTAWLDRVHPDDIGVLKEELKTHLDGRRPQFSAEHRIRHEDGTYRWVLTRGVAVRDEDGKARRMAGSQSDVTHRKVAEEQLRFDNLHDKLTGLPNRALLLERTEQSLLRQRREPGRGVAVLVLDLDGFKRVNDTLGHIAGDRLLVSVSERLVTELQAVETAGMRNDPCVARLGGDEFVVLLDGVGGSADATRVADRLQRAINRPFIIDDAEVFTAMSMGIAIAQGPEHADELLRDADLALYHAKAGGKGRYILFDRATHSEAFTRWSLEGELRKAIDVGDLRLHYQPICSVETQRPVSLEALIRWQHPTRGLIQPAEIIPLAEETGLIIPLGRWVLREACRQMREWQGTFGDAMRISVAVNLSARQLIDLDLVAETRRALKDHGIDASLLKIELTESAVMENSAAALEVIAELRKLGIRIHLDDFGTGYSSLARLQQMPIDALKIDQAFTRTMMSDPASNAIVKMIIALAHLMNVRVIAEGVENAEQLGGLRENQCDLVQGYHLYRPADAAATTTLLRLLALRPVAASDLARFATLTLSRA